jgi:hypothetical protein
VVLYIPLHNHKKEFSMESRQNVERELIPDCCMTCSECLVEECTLVCNYDGVDILPFQKCNKYKRLKFYGEYKIPYRIPLSLAI